MAGGSRGVNPAFINSTRLRATVSFTSPLSCPCDMDFIQSSIAYLPGAAAILLIWAFFKHSKRHAMPYPPGPQPLPFIGNALDFPTEQEWLVFRKWNEQYGNVVYTEALGRKMVVLGSASVVSDLLERKSAIYSDRPHLVMTLDL
jgi:hypothetical protein